jgi:hypothetical protein
MRNLIGQNFPLADRVYRIVDVRQVAGDAMIYAEPVEAVAAAGTGGHGPQAAGPARAARAAFHYRDIAAHLPGHEWR